MNFYWANAMRLQQEVSGEQANEEDNDNVDDESS